MSYPRNAASPPRIAIGPVVQISDGAVQTSGVSITVVPQGASAGAGAGTTSYENGAVLYVPTQAETNYEAFVVIAYKTGCIPAAVTVVTSASATAGKVVLSGETHTSAVIPTVTTLTNAPSDSSGTTTLLSRVSSTRAGYFDNLSGGAVALASGVNVSQWGGVAVASATVPANVVQISGDAAAADSLEAALDGTGGVTISAALVGNITGSLSGSVGSVTGNVGGNVTGSVGSIAGVTFPTHFASLSINASGHIARVVLCDTITTYTGNTVQTGDSYARIGANGSGLTSLAPLDAAGVRSAVGLASANLDTQLADLPTNSELATAITTGLTTALTEGYRADGATGSVRDLLYELIAHMGEASIVSTTKTIKKIDGSTTAATYTLDSGSAPTSITRAS